MGKALSVWTPAVEDSSATSNKAITWAVPRTASSIKIIDSRTRRISVLPYVDIFVGNVPLTLLWGQHLTKILEPRAHRLSESDAANPSPCAKRIPFPTPPHHPSAPLSHMYAPQNSLLLLGSVLLPLMLLAGGGEMERTEAVSSSWEQPAWMARR